MNQDYLPYALLSLQMITNAVNDVLKGQDCQSIRRWLEDDTARLPYSHCIHFLQCVLDANSQGTLCGQYLKTQIESDPTGALKILSSIRTKIHSDSYDTNFINGLKLCQSLKD